MSTPTLLESYRNLARDVQLLENRLDPHLWRTPVEASSKPPPGWNPDARLRVLYCGGYTHASDLSLVLSVFEQLAPSGVALHVVGVEHDNRPGYARIPVPNSRYDRFVPWFRSIARHFDVAIAPLEDTPFNRCKSPLKFMEFAACGLPTIASNCGPYARTIRHEEDGLLAVGTSEWLTALRRLLNDAVFRRELAQRAWRRAQEEFFCTDCAFDAMPWRRRLGAQDLGRRASVASQGLSGAASETGG